MSELMEDLIKFTIHVFDLIIVRAPPRSLIIYLKNKYIYQTYNFSSFSLQPGFIQQPVRDQSGLLCCRVIYVWRRGFKRA